MSKVVKVLKVVGKVVVRIGLVALLIFLLFSNKSLKKDYEKQKLIIKNYEQEYFGVSEQAQDAEVEAGEVAEVANEKDFSTEEMNNIVQKIYSVEKRVEALEKREQNSTVVNSETVKVDEEESIKDFLERKFPFDGNYYKNEGECQFYADTFCTQKLDSQNLRFLSQITDDTTAENGLNITCLLTDDWKIVYCTQSPYLITESEYEEINYQK